MGDTTTVTVRVPSELKTRLDKLADATSRSRSWLAAHALQVAQQPHLGRPGREPETRELIVAGTSYIVPYKIHKDHLAILAVPHDSQDRPED